VTHYEVLGVDPGADPAAIRQAWLRLARRHHPDFHGTAGRTDRAEADRRMREINEAWSVLRDPGRRLDYDRRLGLRPDGVGGPWGFRPLDDGDEEAVAPPAGDDDAGPPPTLPRRALVIAPVALFALAVATFCLALVLDAPAVVGVALAEVVLAGLLFVLVPLVALAEAERAPGAGPAPRRRGRRPARHRRRRG
jgi:curved DNA-binding protein CbpA